MQLQKSAIILSIGKLPRDHRCMCQQYAVRSAPSISYLTLMVQINPTITQN